MNGNNSDNKPKRIASFSVDHDFIKEGMYISRIDDDIKTYDLRTRIPNGGDYIDDLTMHSVEHMLATFLRNSSIGEKVIYFGPMGCRTGFYLLVRGVDDLTVFNEVKLALQKTVEYNGEIFGGKRKECGNYKCLSLESAKKECQRYLDKLQSLKNPDFKY